MGWNPVKPFKSIGRSVSNLIKGDFKDAGKHIGKASEEFYKVTPLYYGLSLLDDYIRPEMPDLPPTPDPIATPETGGDSMDAMRRRKKRAGRASTIQAGSLIPENVGIKSLLG